MSDRLFQCKSCGARVLQTVYPGSEPLSCPKCKARNWVELRGYKSGRARDKDWMQQFLAKLAEGGEELRWR